MSAEYELKYITYAFWKQKPIPQVYPMALFPKKRF
jgi:hypothetical protein